MRVLHVIESLAAGGIETTFLNVLRSWRRTAPWATHHVLAFSGGALEAAYREAADAVTIAAGLEEQVRLLAAPWEVVYFTFERCAVRLLPLAIARSRAAVVYGKGYDMGGMFRLNDGFRWQPDESVMWGADHLTFTTAPLAQGFELPPQRATVLGKAADVGKFLALAPPDASTPRRIVCVANLHARKRLGDLALAVSSLRRDWPDLTLRFVGADDGGEGARLVRLAAAHGFARACELVGRRADVAGDLAASRVFALPSGCEGVPTAMLEAMAAGRPVVVTDVGHITSVVTDGVEGYVVPPGDIAALTDRLRRLVADPAAAGRMGLAARVRAKSHDVGAVAARLRDVLVAAGREQAA